MSSPRLTGLPLHIVRSLSALKPVLRILWASSTGDFRFKELATLSSENRGAIPDAVRPIQVAPPRRFGSFNLNFHKGARTSSADLHTAYAAGADPVVVLERILQRQDWGLALNSPFVELDQQRARADALAARDRWRAGIRRSSLDGVPISIKDHIHMQGLPTRTGTAYRTARAEHDAWVTKRLRAAGAVLFAKTHAAEWGVNPIGASQFFDVPRNPYDSSRGAGGSSIGAGVAVALGCGPMALGSDSGGSIRVPAAMTGVFGLKPTHVRIGRTGDLWGGGTLSHQGPIGASTHDLVELLSASSGVDLNDLTTMDQPQPDIPAWRTALIRGVKGARIGVPHSEWAHADSGVAEVAERGLTALVAAGAQLVDIDIPLAEHAPGIGALTIAIETAAELSDDFAAHGACFGDELALIVRLMSQVPIEDYLRAVRTRAALRRQVAEQLTQVDLIALPTTRTVAARYDRQERGILDTKGTSDMTRFAFLANLTGLPAGTAPVGMCNGLPVGLQLIGDAWDEASVLAALAEMERSVSTDVPLPEAYRSMLT